MTVKEYEEFMQTSKFYPQDKLPITYPILGLNGEAGEAAEKVKKCWRDNDGVFTDEINKTILKELADVLWYIWAAADDMGYTLADVFLTSMKKVKERQKTNTVHGNGDDREKQTKCALIKEAPSSILEPINVEYNEGTLRPKKLIAIRGEYESFKKIKYVLTNEMNNKRYPKITVCLFNESEHFEFIGTLRGFGRMDGSLLIQFDNEDNVDKIYELINNYPTHYVCKINNDQIYEAHASIIQIKYED